jgi:hypothetical protein
MATVTSECRENRDHREFRFCLNIEGVEHPWPVSTIYTEQIAEVGGWDPAQGVLMMDADGNERTLEPCERITLQPGLAFCEKVKWRRG